MEKLVLFPLNNDTEVLINNWEKSNEYQIAALSSYYEHQESLKLLQEEKAFFCDTDFAVCLDKADAVVFAENTMGHSYEGYKERVLLAQKSGKKIYIHASIPEKIGVACEKNDLLQGYIFPKDLQEEIIFREIDVPIISIMGMGENCDKFNLQVKVKKIIEKQGYHVLSICSNVLGKFLGMEILPEFLYSKSISYPEKINYLNIWIYQLQKQRKPDIILLGCPGGISEFEDFESNFYGEIPLVVANSVSIDYGIITLYANMEQDVNSVKKLSDYSMLKYNTEVETFIFSNQYFNIDYEWRKINYYKINVDNLPTFQMEGMSNYHITYIGDDLMVEEQVKNILIKLQNNLHVF